MEPNTTATGGGHEPYRTTRKCVPKRERSPRPEQWCEYVIMGSHGTHAPARNCAYMGQHLISDGSVWPPRWRWTDENGVTLLLHRQVRTNHKPRKALEDAKIGGDMQIVRASNRERSEAGRVVQIAFDCDVEMELLCLMRLARIRILAPDPDPLCLLHENPARCTERQRITREHLKTIT